MPKMLTLTIIAGIAVLAVTLYFVFATKGADSGGFDYFHVQKTLETGTAGSARILAMRDTGGRLNSNPVVEFQLEVQPASGPSFAAVTRTIVSTVDLPRYQPGAIVAVKYDAADHSSVAIVQ